MIVAGHNRQAANAPAAQLAVQFLRFFNRGKGFHVHGPEPRNVAAVYPGKADCGIRLVDSVPDRWTAYQYYGRNLFSEQFAGGQLVQSYGDPPVVRVEHDHGRCTQVAGALDLP